MTARVRPELALGDCGLRCDTFNIICRARLEQANARNAALEAVSYFARADRPFSWWLGPADRPERLGAVLEDLGLARTDSELAMALPLEAARDPGETVPGLEVRRVRAAAELDAFARLGAANWDPPDADVLAFYRRTAPALLGPGAPLRMYLGYLDREPVATAEASVEAGTAALFNVGTRPGFRGRGIASLVMRRVLREVHAAGCDLAVLQAAEAGIGLYRRLGFVSFGQITEFKPPTPPDSSVAG